VVLSMSVVYVVVASLRLYTVGHDLYTVLSPIIISYCVRDMLALSELDDLRAPSAHGIKHASFVVAEFRNKA
jgi:hypothetical protein